MTVYVSAMHEHVQRMVIVVKVTIVLEGIPRNSSVLWCGFCGQMDSMQRIFRNKCFLFTMGNVCRVKWYTTGSWNLSQGLSKVADDARPGRSVEFANEATVQGLEKSIWVDRWITIDSASTALGCSHGLAYSIMHERFKFRKVCTQWLLRELKDPGKMNWMGLFLQHLLRYADEGGDMLNRIVTLDESLEHHYQPESKHA
jgi:hypothetical protein